MTPTRAIAALASFAVCTAACAQGPSTPLLLVDDAQHPTVTVSWPTRDGSVRRFHATREYLAPADRTPLGDNLDAYVAMGGTRLDRGIGHPRGAILRVGFYRRDPAALFFHDIARDAVITVSLTGLRFNQPAQPMPQSVIHHLQYGAADLAACGLGGAALDLYNTVNHEDTLVGKLTPDNARLGALDASDAPTGEPRRGSVSTRVEDDGSITLEARIPYHLFRHVRDPWLRTAPGAFLEPTHFHVELEVLPTPVAEYEREHPRPILKAPPRDDR